MHPIHEFVVKVAARCNLDCDYCYEYRHGDDSWKAAPKFLSMDAARALARRIKEHAASHRLTTVAINLHGGEPLLAGEDRLDKILCELRSIENDGVTIEFAVQTNGTLFTPGIVGVLRKHGVRVGLSIDGPQGVNDLHRQDHQGRSSFEAVAEGLAVLKRYAPELFAGVLAVIDVRSKPLEVFDFIASTGTPFVDFLLPHYNWDRPPPRPDASPTCYGEWYYTIYSAWIAGRHSQMRIRFLENIIRRLVGGTGLYEQMTVDPVTLLVINTNGDIEGVDTLKSTGAGMQKLGVNVRGDSIEKAVNHPLIRVRQEGTRGLGQECRACDEVDICAGGYMPHRYSAAAHFDNRSVYCSDLYWLIKAIRQDLYMRTQRDAA